MTGYDIQEYQHLIDNVLPNVNMTLSTKGESIVLMYGKETAGHFKTIGEARQFALGFDWGLSKGICGTYIKKKRVAVQRTTTAS